MVSLNIVPELGQHAALTGKTGSGKTTTAIVLLTAIQQTFPVLVIDSKGEQKFEQLPGAAIVERPSQLHYSGVEIYRPEGILNDAPFLDAVLAKAYEAAVSMYIYIDEGYMVSARAKPGPGLANCLMRGRHRNIRGRSVRMSTIVSSQRPAWLPRHVFTEATHYYMHQLAEQDRKTMYEYIGDRQIIDDPVAGHDFWYYTHSMPAARRMVIHLR